MRGEKHMGGKFIGVRGVDPKVWERFKAVVVARYGRLNKVMGEAVTEALRLYIEKYGSGGGSPPPKKEESTRTQTKVKQDLDNIKQQILHIAEPGGSISKKLLEYIIISVSNVYDKRSIMSRIRALVADGFIRPEGPNGGSSPIYRIIGPNSGN
jgi:hypothetical protein